MTVIGRTGSMEPVVPVVPCTSTARTVEADAAWGRAEEADAAGWRALETDTAG